MPACRTVKAKRPLREETWRREICKCSLYCFLSIPYSHEWESRGVSSVQGSYPGLSKRLSQIDPWHIGRVEASI